MNNLRSDLEELVKRYETSLNTHDIEKATELVDKNAEFWFNDGSYIGLNEIKNAFVKTWELIEDEVYTISNLTFIAMNDTIAVCIYNFNWVGNVNGIKTSQDGRGTNVWSKASGSWKIIHEHLSEKPEENV